MTVEKHQSIAEHIERAASLIDEFDWIRFNLWRKGFLDVEHPWEADRFCIVGAVFATADGGSAGDLDVSTNIAKRALGIYLGRSPSHWNDHFAVGKEDVIVHMLDCAKALREGRIEI